MNPFNDRSEYNQSKYNERNETKIIDVKVTVVGESAAGKSSLSRRIVYDDFKSDINTTIGAAYLVIKKTRGPYTFKLNFWDTAGQEKYKSLVPMYIKGATVVLLVFDITNRESFQEIKRNWYGYAMTNAELSTKILVGTKLDLESERRVSTAEVEEFAQSRNLKYIECSSKLNQNVDKILEIILSSVSPILPPEIFLTKETVDINNNFGQRVESCMGGNRCYTY